MFKLNKKIEYAFFALNQIQKKKKTQLTTAKEICDTYKIPFDPTARVLQLLTQNGILKAEQGIKGGYKLAKDISKISLKQLSNMIVGPIEITNCQSKSHIRCKRENCCVISKSFKNLNKKLNVFFDNIKITELLNRV